MTEQANAVQDYRALVKYKAPYHTWEFIRGVPDLDAARAVLLERFKLNGRTWIADECVLILPADSCTLDEHIALAADRPFAVDVQGERIRAGTAPLSAEARREQDLQDADRIAKEIAHMRDTEAYVERCRRKRVTQLMDDPGGPEVNGRVAEIHEVVRPFTAPPDRLDGFLHPRADGE